MGTLLQTKSYAYGIIPALRKKGRKEVCEICQNSFPNARPVFNYQGFYIKECWNFSLLCDLHCEQIEQGSRTYDKDVHEQVKINAMSRASMRYLKRKFPQKNWENIFNQLFFNHS